MPSTNNPATAANGCNGCPVQKGFSACGDHLTNAIPVIAKAFAGARMIFDRWNSDHMQRLVVMLDRGIINDDGTPLKLQVPSDPKLKDAFFAELTAQSRGEQPKPIITRAQATPQPRGQTRAPAVLPTFTRTSRQPA